MLSYQNQKLDIGHRAKYTCYNKKNLSNLLHVWTMVCFTFMHYSKVQLPQTLGVLVLMKLGNVACCSTVPIRGGGGEWQLRAVSRGVLQGQQCGQVCIMLHLSHRFCHRRQWDHLPQWLRHQWVLIVIFWLFFFLCFLFLYIIIASLPGQFLSRHCFTLCITMEVEHRTAKQYKCHHCCSCKNYHGKGIEGGQKVSLHRFSADQKIASSWKKWVLGHPIAQATSYCLLPDTFWQRASKNAFKVGSVKLANSLSLPSIVKKVGTGSKSSQGT